MGGTIRGDVPAFPRSSNTVDSIDFVDQLALHGFHHDIDRVRRLDNDITWKRTWFQINTDSLCPILSNITI